MKLPHFCLMAALALAAGGCARHSKPSTATPGSFGDDVAFLRRHTDVIELTSPSGQARVAVVPAWQGRVMTSTANGPEGASYGWINRPFIAARSFRRHINPFGGEDRFWLGPEGGQFALFFAPKAPFDLDHWYTPAVLDTEPFALVGQSQDAAHFQRTFTLRNYSGSEFTMEVDRTVRLLAEDSAWSALGVPSTPGLNVVAFESVNRVRNTGRRAWEPATGLVSIWILGMFNATPETTVVVPLQPGVPDPAHPQVNADYFGPVPPERLVVREDHAFFRGDGRYRSKIGVGPRYAQPIMGSYDPASQVLTLVLFTYPPGTDRYVNSQWRIQDNPFGGDVINSYSDDGKLGAFFELESSSPAAALAPGQTLEHTHRTFHLRGDKAALNQVARTCLGVGLDEIAAALPAK